MKSAVSVTFRFAGIFFGKAIVMITEDGVFLHSQVFNRDAIRIGLNITPALAKEVVLDLRTRSVRVAGHFVALRGRYPFSTDPATRIEAVVVWVDANLLSA